MATKKQIDKNILIANEIRQFLLDKGMWIDTRIYFNGMAYCSSPVYDHGNGVLGVYKEGAKNINYNNPNYLHVIPEIDPSNYFDYVNLETISMSFESDFYGALNHGEGGWEVEEEFAQLLKKHGYYYEKGNAWNLSIYKI